MPAPHLRGARRREAHKLHIVWDDLCDLLKIIRNFIFPLEGVRIHLRRTLPLSLCLCPAQLTRSLIKTPAQQQARAMS